MRFVAPAALAAALFALAVPAVAQTTADSGPIGFGTAPEASPLGRYGQALAARLAVALGREVTVEVTGGSLPNSILIQEGDIQLGLVAFDAADAGWRGESTMAPGLRLDRLRALAPVAPALVQFGAPVPVVLPLLPEEGAEEVEVPEPPSPGITTLAQLKGKRLAIAPRDDLTPRLLDSLGAGVRVRKLEASEVPEEFAEERLSAIAVVDALPLQPPPGMAMRPFGFTDEEVGRLVEAFPWLEPAALPGGGGRTVAVWTWLVGSADLPDEVAAAVTRVALDEGPGLAAAAGLTAGPGDPLGNRVLPFHRGAAAAYAERGLVVPSDRVE